MTTETPEAIPNVDEVVYSGFGEEMAGTGFPAPAWVEVEEAAPAAPEEPSAPEPPLEPEGVPVGTIAEVKEWVGNDPVRAQQALDAENASDDPRVTLIDWLEGIIG